MRILGIDQGSSKCGFAFLEDEKFSSIGHWRMKEKDRYERYDVLMYQLDLAIRVLHPDLVAIENVFAKRSGFNNPKTSIIMGETRGIIMAVCLRNSVNFIDINPSELTKYLGINTRKVNKKVATMEYISEYTGIKIDDEDGADAALISLIAKEKLNGL